MKPIDMSTYPRKDAFAFFSGASNPFYSVTFEQDVTKLYAYAHEKGLSFYHAMSYLVTKAMNQVQMFRYVVKDGVIYEIDGRTPSLTELRKGEEQYYCVNVPFVDDMEAFCAEAAKRRDSQREFMKAAEETSDLLFISCLPWVEITGLTNPRDFDQDDSVPRVVWGKYVKKDERVILHIAVEVNHRLVDGLHIGRFAQRLTALIEAL